MFKSFVAATVIFSSANCTKPDAAPAEIASAAVRLHASEGGLASLIKAEVDKAHAQKLRPFLELRAEWCGPCKKLEASMGDTRMQQAFAGTYLISVDIDEWKTQLDQIKVSVEGIPAFYELDEQATPTGRKIDGGAWGKDTPANMAPPLKAFFAQ